MWSVEWQPSTSRLREYVVSPSKCCPGSDLPRQAWVKLNRLRTGIGRLNGDMWRWGLSKSPACDFRGDQQTANHIITECPLYCPPNGLHGLIDVDADATTRKWLLSKFPEIEIFIFFYFYGFTSKKEVVEYFVLRFYYLILPATFVHVLFSFLKIRYVIVDRCTRSHL